MRRPAFWLLGLLGLVGGALAVFWMLGQRAKPGAPGPRGAARPLVAFAPDRVRRVRLQGQKRWLDRSRTAVGWGQTRGRPDQGTPVDVEALLGVLLQLRGRRVDLDRHGAPSLSRSRSALRVRLWMASGRSIGVAFFRRDGQVLARTGRRRGIFRVGAEPLARLERALGGAPSAGRAVPARRGHLGAVFVQVPGKRVRLRKRSGRWFVRQGEGWVAADSDRVSTLVNDLLAIRATRRLGEGAAARKQYPLPAGAAQVVLDDGRQWTLRIGGACPGHPAERLAHRSPGDGVLCVPPLGAELLRRPFPSTRLFSVSPDEVRSIEVVRGRRRLALEYRPGKGGWVAGHGADRAVDPDAAVRLLTTLAGLHAVAQQADRPGALRPEGSVTLTPRGGKGATATLWAAPGSEAFWARRGSDGPWMRLGPGVTWALDASGRSLRSLRLCHGDPAQVVGLYRTGIGGYSEWLYTDRGAWQILLLVGAPAAQRAREAQRHMERYRSLRPGRRGHPATLSWKRPVAGLLVADSELRSSLFYRMTHLRAELTVAPRARPEHGLGRDRVRVTLWHRYGCRDVDGRRRCQIGTCDVEVGQGAGNAPGCFARRVGDATVFALPATACPILRRPLASRAVTGVALGQLQRVTLRAGRASRVFRHGADGEWRRTAPGGARNRDLGTGLLFLAPLRARAVVSYGPPPRPGRPLLRAALKLRALPPVGLTFYAPRRPGGPTLVTRRGRPVRYAVPAAPVRRLRRWAEGKGETPGGGD